MDVFHNLPSGIVELTIAENDIYRTDLLPGFELPLATLLLAADKWKK